MIKDLHHRLCCSDQDAEAIAAEFLPIVGLDPLPCAELLNARFSACSALVQYCYQPPRYYARHYTPLLLANNDASPGLF